MNERGLDLVTASPEETDRLGLALGRALVGGEAIALIGPLGAGKTRLVKALAAGLGFDPRDVSSPTFLLITEHVGPVRLFHVDAWRTGGAEELGEAGGGDIFRSDAVAVVEWADRAPGFLPDDHLRVEIEFQSELARRLRLRATGPGHRRLLDSLAASMAGWGNP